MYKEEPERKIEGGLRLKGLFKRKSGSDKTLVSIITVCLNSEKYLEQTIRSVIGQTYNNIEYIIVDGGSKDRTLDIIREYEDKVAYWVSEPDKGIYDAMNKGISFSNGNLIGMINSDDWYESKAVEKVVEEWRKDKEAGVLFGDLMFVLQTKRRTFYQMCKANLQLIEKQMSIYHPSCFITKKIYENWKYDLSFKLTADYDLLLKLYFSEIKFHYVNRVLAYHRAGGVSRPYKISPENYIIRKKYLGGKKAILLFFKETNYFFKVFLFHIFLRDNLDHKLLWFYQKWIKGGKDANS